MPNLPIPTHQLLPEEYFLIERIENMDISAFEEIHRHNFYEVLWFTAAENERQQIDFISYEIVKNQVYILSPSQIHSMEIGTKKGYLLAFPKAVFEKIEIPTSLLMKPYFSVFHLSETVAKVLSTLLALMEEEFKGERRKSLLETYCKAFFIQIQPFHESKNNAYSNRIAQLLKLVDEHFIAHKEVSFYAQHLNISERRMNEIAVQHTGETVKQLIMSRTITEAKRYLGTNEFSVKEIAHKIGFDDAAYFSRLFKNKATLSPEEFRTNEQRLR